jgi:uncharacterized protein
VNGVRTLPPSQRDARQTDTRFTDKRSTDARPWHRQFWPWFLIALPLASVVLGVVTVSIALRDPDALVRDDWYDAGMTINRDFDRERAAAELGLAATIRLMPGAVEVALSGSGAADIDRVMLDLAHPADSARDRHLELLRFAPGQLRVAAEDDLTGNWNAALAPVDSSWLIASRVALFPGRDARVVAAPVAVTETAMKEPLRMERR